MSKTIFNFSAGPAVLPKEVLKKAADEMLNYKDSGMSVMELSHRSAIYQEIIDATEAGLRKLMNIPENYKVLFLQGGASSQFAMIPMNLMGKNKKADYINTGAWSKKAISEAKRFGDIKVIASSEDKTFSYIPEINPNEFREDADYIHITSNNTIYGTKLMQLPKTPAGIPIVADMSSNIMSEEINIEDYALIYAGAQKNIGPAGVTVVIIREDLIGNAIENTPTMFNYKTHSDKGSMFNTPPTYGIYIARLVFDHMLEKGGVKYYEKLNGEKASLLYNYLDKSEMFSATVSKHEDRSIMNIPFVATSDDLNKKFIAEAATQGLVTLKGHRSVGGMRASIYNAMPLEGVQKLVEFMTTFEKENL